MFVVLILRAELFRGYYHKFIFVIKNSDKSMANQEENINPKKRLLLDRIATLLEQYKTNGHKHNVSVVLEICGRQCAQTSAIQLATDSGGNLEKFLKNLGLIIGEKNIENSGDIITIRYDECYCTLVAENPDTPEILCECSNGWVKEMFETVINKPLIVEGRGSILRGDPQCEFKIHIENL